jgi:hypothetical protein
MAARVVDTVSLYRRGHLEKVMWERRLDGLTDDQIASLVGLPCGEVRKTLEKMLVRVQTDGELLARSWAVKQTMALWTEVYQVAADEWLLTKDPRYAEVMRGALKDIRDIWGVDKAKRVLHAHAVAGVIHTDLGRFSKDELEMLARLFPAGEGNPVPPGLDAGEDSDGVVIPGLSELLSDGDGELGGGEAPCFPGREA